MKGFVGEVKLETCLFTWKGSFNISGVITSLKRVCGTEIGITASSFFINIANLFCIDSLSPHKIDSLNKVCLSISLKGDERARSKCSLGEQAEV